MTLDFMASANWIPLTITFKDKDDLQEIYIHMYNQNSLALTSLLCHAVLNVILHTIFVWTPNIFFVLLKKKVFLEMIFRNTAHQELHTLLFWILNRCPPPPNMGHSKWNSNYFLVVVLFTQDQSKNWREVRLLSSYI